MNDLREDKSKGEYDLKTRFESSHNQDEHAQILAIVKFLARRAAEEDFADYLDAQAGHPDILH